MNLLIFDMDGVLLKPQGYHRALKETVRLAGLSIGVGEVILTDQQIAQFEALGISSEWDSSALCMAVIVLHKQIGRLPKNGNLQSGMLDLTDLFDAIAVQPIEDSALNRGLKSIQTLIEQYHLPSSEASELVNKRESIQHSPTLNWFQELILGSDVFSDTYHKPAQLKTESYLKLFDQRLLSEGSAEQVIQWARNKDCGAAIMTNRPSRGLPGIQAAPDAEMGAALVDFDSLSLVGYGEVSWLAQETHRDPGELSKPAWPHALAAILTAGGWSLKHSLNYLIQSLETHQPDNLHHLENCQITVFEDTPGGVIAVQAAGRLLNELGLGVKLRKIGIADDPVKQAALAAHGAAVYSDINLALASLGIIEPSPSID
jgi:hypothetical protein